MGPGAGGLTPPGVPSQSYEHPWFWLQKVHRNRARAGRPENVGGVRELVNLAGAISKTVFWKNVGGVEKRRGGRETEKSSRRDLKNKSVGGYA